MKLPRRRALGRLLRTEWVPVFAVAAISAGMVWLVTIYGNALRDPRYLDGWILAGLMAFQLLFHIAVKTARLSPKSVMRWRRVHIFLGYVLIGVFISHMNVSLPDTGLEWALFAGLASVTLSGIFGTYLASSKRAGRVRAVAGGEDQIAARRVELAHAVHSLVTKSEAGPADAVLPAPPFQAWISDLHTSHLKDHFGGRRAIFAHLFGSERPLTRVTDEIDSLSRFVDRQHQDKLDTIKTLAIEKYRLDFSSAQIALTHGWLYLHIPITYSLIVLSILHIVVVYAFASGVW